MTTPPRSRGGGGSGPGAAVKRFRGGAAASGGVGTPRLGSSRFRGALGLGQAQWFQDVGQWDWGRAARRRSGGVWLPSAGQRSEGSTGGSASEWAAAGLVRVALGAR